MKARLPKILLTGLLIALATTAQATDYNVGVHTGKNNLPSSASNYWTHTENDLTLTGTDRLGYISGDTLVTGLGKEQWNASWGKWTQASSGTVTKNVKINGTLTIEDDAQVVLGGQYKTATDAFGISSVDEYTGIIANKVVVNGNESKTSLSSWNASVNVLEINSGNVRLHDKVQSGNNHFVYEDKDSKQVRIKQALHINGGNTVINLNQLDSNNGADDTHVFTSFGSINFTNPKYTQGSLTGADSAEIASSQITQTAGTLTVNGKTASVGGLNISQSGGTMNISTDGSRYHSWHILSDYGDSTITQSGDAVLNIGGIKAYNSKYDTVLDLLLEKGVSYDPNSGELSSDGRTVEINPSISINQTGSGSISIVKGIDFTNQKSGEASSEISKIKQSGSGSINLSGTYSGVTFDVEQSGSGTINMNSSMSLNEVKLSDENGTGGKLNIAAGAVVTAGSITIDGGSIVNNGTINGVVSMAMRAAGETINITDGELVNSGTINASINMTGGTLVAEAGSEIAGISATGGDILVEGDFTMTGDLMLDGDAELIFADADYTIDLGKYDVVFTGNSSIALTLGDADISEVVLFTGAKEDTYSGYKVALLDEEGNSTGTAVLEYNEDGTVTLGAAAVPEPTTATLSLLALAALAARRRRK